MKADYKQVATETEEPEQPVKYPLSVFFIIGNEFCERYSTFGMTAILVLYLHNILLYTEEEARTIFHTLIFMANFFPIFGGVLADSYLGKFRTLLYMSTVHALGNITVALAATEVFSPRLPCMLGLLLISIGVGGIKPCVATFGGDQFVMPQQAEHLKRFFSIFYFTNNVGALIATLTAPILRQDVKCFGHNTCYPFAFGMPAFLMVVALALFIFGKPWYKIRKPEGNVLADASKCIFHALQKKLSSRDDSKKPSHWIEYAEDEFDPQLIKDIKEALRVMIMYLPVPVYWALSDQQASSWIFQSSQMDGVVFNWFTIKPDQLSFLNPFICLVFIPFNEAVFYPILRKIGIKRPLQLITIGASLNATAFFMSAIVEYKLESSYPVLPEYGSGQIRIFNGFPCQIELDPPINGHHAIPPLGALQLTDIKIDNGTSIMEEKLNLVSESSCKNVRTPINWTEEISIFEKRSTSYVVSVLNESTQVRRIPGFDDVTKSPSNVPKIRIIHNLNGSLTLTNQYGSEFIFQLPKADLVTSLEEIHSGRYKAIYENKTVLSDLLIESGGVYTLVLQKIDTKMEGSLHVITPPAALHMMWELPQIFVISMAEIFFYPTYISFTFTEAPESMRSVLASVANVSIALGNLLVVLVSKLNLFNRKIYQILFWTGLMCFDIILLIVLAINFKYRNYESADKRKGLYASVEMMMETSTPKTKKPTENKEEKMKHDDSESDRDTNIRNRDSNKEKVDEKYDEDRRD